MLPEELSVSYRRKLWCRWVAGLLLLIAVPGCLISLAETVGAWTSIAAGLLLLGVVAIVMRFAMRRRTAKIIELTPDPCDRNQSPKF